MGRHSGIPRCCCTWFFVRLWAVPKPLKRLSADYMPYWTLEYIRCPICALRNREVAVHMCHPGCGSPKRST